MYFCNLVQLLDPLSTAMLLGSTNKSVRFLRRGRAIEYQEAIFKRNMCRESRYFVLHQ